MWRGEAYLRMLRGHDDWDADICKEPLKGKRSLEAFSRIRECSEAAIIGVLNEEAEGQGKCSREGWCGERIRQMTGGARWREAFSGRLMRWEDQADDRISQMRGSILGNADAARGLGRRQEEPTRGSILGNADVVRGSGRRQEEPDEGKHSRECWCERIG
jgi:hypothetical protein